MSQASGFEEEEKEDNKAEGHVSEVQGVGRRAHSYGDGTQAIVKEFYQNDSKKRPDSGSHTADNKVTDEPDRKPEVEKFWEGDSLPVDPERASHAGIGTANEEGKELGAGESNAHDIGGELIITDCDEGSAESGSYEVSNEESTYEQYNCDEVEEFNI